jgi:hypothetical protein
MMSPEGEGSLLGEKREPQPRIETDQKARSTLAFTIALLFNIVAKVVVGSEVSKSHREIRNAFTITARSVLRHLRSPFNGLLRISGTPSHTARRTRHSGALPP